MSQLTELIDKTIHDIQFNGCTLPESIIRLQFDNIVACAKLEESIERNTKYLESIGTAFGNGANDRPNVIGDMITEPSLTPEQMVKGEWYVVKLEGDCIPQECLTKHERTNEDNDLLSQILVCDGHIKDLTDALLIDGFDYIPFMEGTIRPATKEEVLKYFPDETFGEPADYVNPITN